MRRSIAEKTSNNIQNFKKDANNNNNQKANKNELKSKKNESENDHNNEPSSLNNISISLTNIIVNQKESDQKNLENKKNFELDTTKFSNSLTNQIIANNKNDITSNDEYEEEEEEEEEYEYEYEEEENVDNNIKDLENEVMITELSSPKTDADENDIKKAGISNKGKNMQQISNNNNDDYTEEELEKELNKFLKTNKIPPISACPKIAAYAREKIVQMMFNEDYDQAYELQNAIKQISTNIDEEKRYLGEKEMTEEIETRISDANQQQKDLNYTYKDKIEEFERLQKQSHEKLLQRHQEEIDRFLADWDNDRKLYPFLKQSPKLLQLRQMQKTQAITMNFIQAKQLKKAADKLQKEETQIAKINASNAMKAEYDALLKQQQKEIESWSQNWERKRQTLEMEQHQKEEANENLRNQLHNKLIGKKMPKKQSVILPINYGFNKSVQTMRTQAKTMMIEYRSKTPAARLDLRPAEIKAIIKPRLQTPRKLSSSFS